MTHSRQFGVSSSSLALVPWSGCFSLGVHAVIAIVLILPIAAAAETALWQQVWGWSNASSSTTLIANRSGSLDVQWSSPFPMANCSAIDPNHVVVDAEGAVFVAAGADKSFRQCILKRNGTTGEVMWSLDSEGDPFQMGSPLALSRDSSRLYAAFTNNSMRFSAMDARTGQVLWQAGDGQPGNDGCCVNLNLHESPDGTAYISCWTMETYIRLVLVRDDGDKGTVLWNIEPPGGGITNFVSASSLFPASGGRPILFAPRHLQGGPVAGNRIYAYDLLNGTQLWTYDMPDLFMINVAQAPIVLQESSSLVLGVGLYSEAAGRSYVVHLDALTGDVLAKSSVDCCKGSWISGGSMVPGTSIVVFGVVDTLERDVNASFGMLTLVGFDVEDDLKRLWTVDLGMHTMLPHIVTDASGTILVNAPRSDSYLPTDDFIYSALRCNLFVLRPASPRGLRDAPELVHNVSVDELFGTSVVYGSSSFGMEKDVVVTPDGVYVACLGVDGVVAL